MRFVAFLAMYGLTYVGRMFNVVTLLIAAWVFIFSAPKVYKDNQVKKYKLIILFVRDFLMN